MKEVHGKLFEKKFPDRWWNICVVSDEEVYYQYIRGRYQGGWNRFRSKGGFNFWLREHKPKFNYVEETPFEGNI